MLKNSSFFEVLRGSAPQLDSNVLVLGSINPSFKISLSSIPSDYVYASTPEFRLDHSFMLLSDVKKRLDLAKLVSPNSRNIFLEFLDTPLYSQFSRLADNEVDRSLEYSRTFLDAIDQSEVKYLSLLLAIEAITV